ncbi:hypothetical protein PSCICL_47900 [Pseudomonas cichorii]|nr:hypothetical protein PSCICL_47900 [Pseudomonas cichorii]
MTRLALALMLLTTLAGCDQPYGSNPEPGEAVGIKTWHDEARQATCWIYSHPQYREGGISCLPDWSLQKVESERCLTRDLKSEACRKLFNRQQDSQLKPEARPTPTDAPARRVDERYSM